jgi:hypothetical protein
MGIGGQVCHWPQKVTSKTFKKNALGLILGAFFYVHYFQNVLY